MSERLTPDEVKGLVQEIRLTPSLKTRERLLSTSWVDIVGERERKRKTKIQPKISGEERRQKAQRFAISMALGAIEELVGVIPRLELGDHPDLFVEFNHQVNMFLAALSQRLGRDVETVKRLREEIGELRKENASLRLDKDDLLRRVKSLEKTLGYAEEIHKRDLSPKD